MLSLVNKGNKRYLKFCCKLYVSSKLHRQVDHDVSGTHSLSDQTINKYLNRKLKLQQNMFSMPATFHNVLTKNNYIEKMYKAMESDDYSEIVITALDILKKTQQLPVLPMVTKSVNASNEFRNLGNVAYKKGDLQSALLFYHRALLYAPKNSKEMVLAYSNRSQVLQSQKAFIASLADIEICLTMDCKDILKKLLRRKKEVVKLAQMEQLSNVALSSSAKYIDTDIQRNVEISCASHQIKVDRTDNPKVVAATAVNVGCVLANERAFVSYTIPDNYYYSCHFCQSITLNLIPCDGCCHVLFCDEVCKKSCITEYHEYECQIMDIVIRTLFGPSPNLMFKASLKIRAMSKSWQKLINDYNNKNTIKNATIKEIFDNKKKFSILQTAIEKPFVYGVLYNSSFVCASLIHYLQELTSFFPKKTDEKKQAICVFSKILMFLGIQQTPIQIVQPSTILLADKTNYFTRPNFGLYSFTGKIKTSCKPNIMAINNNHQLILIALKTINCNEELTISTVKLEEQANRHERNFNNYWVSGAICNCNLCDETIHSWTDKNDQLSKEQIAYLSNLNFGQIDYYMRSLNPSAVYPVIIKALDVLSDVPYSPPYKKIMKYFKSCILYYESIKSKNYLIGPIEE